MIPWAAAHQASLSFTISQSLLKLMSIESLMPSNHLILCHPLLLLSSIFPSNRVFSSESTLLIRWPKYWSFSINPSSEYSESGRSPVKRMTPVFLPGQFHGQRNLMSAEVPRESQRARPHLVTDTHFGPLRSTLYLTCFDCSDLCQNWV